MRTLSGKEIGYGVNHFIESVTEKLALLSIVTNFRRAKGLFALHRKIWFGVCKKIENFVITNFFVFVIAFALETC